MEDLTQCKILVEYILLVEILHLNFFKNKINQNVPERMGNKYFQFPIYLAVITSNCGIWKDLS